MSAILLRFIALGTFVGGGVFSVVRDLASAHTIPSLTQAIVVPANALFISVLSWFLAFPVGVFPASASGFCYWYILNRYTSSNLGPLARGMLGGFLGLLACSLFGLLFSFGDAPGSYSPSVNLLSWASAGAVGGALSALLVRNVTYAYIFSGRGE